MNSKMPKVLIFIVSAALLLCSCAGKGQIPEVLPQAEALSPPESPSPSLSKAEERLSLMSLEEKVWQLMYTYPEDICGEYCCTLTSDWREAFSLRPAGGLAFVGENMPSELELKAMTKAIAQTGAGVFLGLDEEGGSVARLAYNLGVTTDFKPMYEYREEGPAKAKRNASLIARDVKSFGFNMDFAPVADVWTNPGNSVIGKRAYSDDALEAAMLVSAAVKGFHSEGIISVLKHFPGHGNTFEDSHYALARTDKSLDELSQCELLPFISGIEAGAEVIMVGHIIAEKIDPDTPATLSRVIVTDMLRNTLGFEGLIITDAFNMAGVGDTPETEAAVMAIEAGCDMILAPSGPDEVVEAIMENVSEERIDESVLRILELKYEWGILK